MKHFRNWLSLHTLPESRLASFVVQVIVTPVVVILDISKIITKVVIGAWIVPDRKAAIPTNAQLAVENPKLEPMTEPSDAPMDKHGAKIPPAIPDQYVPSVATVFARKK